MDSIAISFSALKVLEGVGFSGALNLKTRDRESVPCRFRIKGSAKPQKLSTRALVGQQRNKQIGYEFRTSTGRVQFGGNPVPIWTSSRNYPIRLAPSPSEQGRASALKLSGVGFGGRLVSVRERGGGEGEVGRGSERGGE